MRYMNNLSSLYSVDVDPPSPKIPYYDSKKPVHFTTDTFNTVTNTNIQKLHNLKNYGS